MSKKDLRGQFIEHLDAKNFKEAYELLRNDAKNGDFELAELQHTFDKEPIFVMEYLCLHYNDFQPLDKDQDQALINIIVNFGRKEYSQKTTPLIFALSADFISTHGTTLAQKLLQAGVEINETREGLYKPLGVVCNEIEKNPALQEKYDGLISELLVPDVEELDLNEVIAFNSDRLAALQNNEAGELAKKRSQPLWVRLVNLGYRDNIREYYAEKSKHFHQLIERRHYAEALIELKSTLALSDMLMSNAISVSDYVFSCLPRLTPDVVNQAAEFLALVAKASENILPQSTISNNVLNNIANAENVDEKLLKTYEAIVKALLKKKCVLTQEHRIGLIRIGIKSNDLVRWGTTPPVPIVSPRSRAGTQRSLTQSRGSIHQSRSRISFNDLSKQLADALLALDFINAKLIVHRDHKLASQDLVFTGISGSYSPARYLTKRYPDCNLEQQQNIREFILDANNLVNSLTTIYEESKDDVFTSVIEMIETFSKKDPEFKAKTKSLSDFIQAQLNPNDESKDASEVEEGESEKEEVQEEEKELTEIVQATILECLNKFDDADFDREEALTVLTRDTLKYAKAVSIDDLTQIIRDIEKTIVKPKDTRWQHLREVVGEIVNQTADHYIQENQRVTATFKKTLWLCLTIIGALVPLIYYFLKVKPTREANPFVVYEMTRNAFDAITAKDVTEEQKTPRGTNTVHRIVEKTSAYSRRLDKIHEKQPTLISHHSEAKPDGHLKRCTFFSHSDQTRQNLFNGSIEDDEFAYDGNVAVTVRSISLKGHQADRFEEKIEDLDADLQGQVIQVF